MARKKYSASEKRAYWIGVGVGIGSDQMNGSQKIADFEKNSTKREVESFRNGSWASYQNKIKCKKK